MIVLLGVPGSGKSTQGQLLVERGKLRWLSMGQLLREEATDKQKALMAAGHLLDSIETTAMLGKKLHVLGDKPEIILDGFPRFIDQAEWLLAQHNAKKLNVSAVINLFAEREVVKQRLMTRGRSDDNEKTISNRFDIYEQTSMPAIDVLKAGGIPILQINADQTPEAILDDIVKGLNTVGVEA